jgi:hypothetical protein
MKTRSTTSSAFESLRAQDRSILETFERFWMLRVLHTVAFRGHMRKRAIELENRMNANTTDSRIELELSNIMSNLERLNPPLSEMDNLREQLLVLKKAVLGYMYCRCFAFSSLI